MSNTSLFRCVPQPCPLCVLQCGSSHFVPSDFFNSELYGWFISVAPMGVCLKPSTRSRVKWWPSSRFLSSQIYRKSLRRFPSCSSVTGKVKRKAKLSLYYSSQRLSCWYCELHWRLLNYCDFAEVEQNCDIFLQPLCGEVLRQLLQEHRPVDCHGVLWCWLRLRHHQTAQQDGACSYENIFFFCLLNNPW